MEIQQCCHEPEFSIPAMFAARANHVRCPGCPAHVPSRDGWDVEGVLIGKQTSGMQNWYVFLVGIVARSGYRPSWIQDMRLVAFSAHDGKLAWEMSQADRKLCNAIGTPSVYLQRSDFRETRMSSA